MTQPVRRFRTRRSRRAVSIVGTLAVVGGGALVAAETLDLGAVAAAIANANRVLLVAAVGVYALSWPLRGRRYGVVLETMDYRCPTAFLTAAVFLSQTANLVVPARAGDGVRAYAIKRRASVPYAAGIAALAVERVFDLLAVAVLALFALAGWAVLGPDASLVPVPSITPETLALALAGVVLLTLGVAVGRRRLRLLTRFVDRSLDALPHSLGDRLRTAVADLADHLRAVTDAPRALAWLSLQSLVIWLLDVATAVLVLAALGTASSVLVVLLAGGLAVSLGNVAKIVPISQGGIGLYEGAFTAVVVATTPIPASLAVAAALLDHALKNGVTVLGGGLAAVWLNLSPTAGTPA